MDEKILYRAPADDWNLSNIRGVSKWPPDIFCCRRLGWSIGISWSYWRLSFKGRHFALWYSLNRVQGSTCDQPGEKYLIFSAMVGNGTRATGRADSELSHWAIITWATGRTDSELSHCSFLPDNKSEHCVWENNSEMTTITRAPRSRD